MRVLHGSHKRGAEVRCYAQTALQASGQVAGRPAGPGGQPLSPPRGPRRHWSSTPHTGAHEPIRSRILPSLLRSHSPPTEVLTRATHGRPGSRAVNAADNPCSGKASVPASGAVSEEVQQTDSVPEK